MHNSRTSTKITYYLTSYNPTTTMITKFVIKQNGTFIIFYSNSIL